RVEAERQGQRFSFLYQGKLTPDAMKGVVTAKVLGRDLRFDFEGKRVKENATLSGAWKLALSFAGGPRGQGGGQAGGARPQGAPPPRQGQGAGPGGGGGRGRQGLARQMMLNLKEEGD